MFAARLHDETLNDFSPREALELLPKSNPLLRSLFSYIAGPELDDRIVWIIDDLAYVFRACDVAGLLRDLAGRPAKMIRSCISTKPSSPPTIPAGASPAVSGIRLSQSLISSSAPLTKPYKMNSA